MQYFGIISPTKITNRKLIAELSKENQPAKPGDYQPGNKIFRDMLFCSEKTLDDLEYEAFVTMDMGVRKKEFFNDPETLNSYFLEKYQTAFFKDADSEAVGNATQLLRKINQDDFKQVIRAHMKILLIKLFEKEDICRHSTYTLVYNWEFFEDTHMMPHRVNMLALNLSNMPGNQTPHADKLFPLQRKGLNVIVNTMLNYPDTHVAGLSFTDKEYSDLSLADFTSPFLCVNMHPLGGYAIEPSVGREVDVIFDGVFKNNKKEFSAAIDDMLAFFDKKIRPFFLLTASVDTVGNQNA